jgi:hypothetical protein
MFFSQLIRELSERYEVTVLSQEDAPIVRDVAILDSASASTEDDIVYFILPGIRLAARSMPKQAIFSGVASALPCACAASVKPEQILSAFNFARKLTENSIGSGFYEELVRVADREKSVESIINSAATQLGNSLIFCDLEYRILACANTVPVVDPLWKNYIAVGHCPYEFVSAAQQLEAVKNVPFFPATIEVSCSESPYQKLSCRVFSHGTPIGFVLMIASSLPATLAHFEMLKNTSLALSYAVERYAPYLYQSIDRYQHVMYQLLIGATASDLEAQIQPLRFPGSMTALCIRQTRYLGQDYVKNHICRELLELFPEAHYCLYEKAIAALLPSEDGISLPREMLDRLETFAGKHHLRIGVSYPFSRIENFAEHFRQCQIAIEMSARRRIAGNVALYEWFPMYDLLSSVREGTNIGAFCHPALETLRQYDYAHNTKLYETLRTYVDTGGSIKTTAEKLFLHRNSLNYRLDIIRNLLHTDLSAASTLFILRFSFDIDRFEGLGS